MWIMATVLAVSYSSRANHLVTLEIFGIGTLVIMAACKAFMSEYDSSHLISSMAGVSAYAAIMGVILFTWSWEMSILAVMTLIACGMRAGAIAFAVGCGFCLMAGRFKK